MMQRKKRGVARAGQEAGAREADRADETIAGPQAGQQIHRAGEQRIVERRGFVQRRAARVDAAVGEAEAQRERAREDAAGAQLAAEALDFAAKRRGEDARVRARRGELVFLDARRRQRRAPNPAGVDARGLAGEGGPARPASSDSCGSDSFAIWPRRRMPAARSRRASAGSIPGSISILSGERKRAS